jgi:integrase
MRQLMPQPWKHPKTGVYYFRKVVPKRLRPLVGRWEIKVSLNTKSLREAKLRYPDEAAQANLILRRAEGGAIELTHKQILALAGEWYKRQLAAREDEPGNPTELEIEADVLIEKYYDCCTPEYRQCLYDDPHQADDFEFDEKYVSTDFLKVVRGDVEDTLHREGLAVGKQTFAMLSERIYDHTIRLLQALRRRALGDYSADKFSDKLPPWVRPPTTGSEETQGKSLQSLFDAWAAERRPPERTLYEWRRIVARLSRHLGHQEGERITKADMVGWKDALLASGKGPKTVKNHVDIIHALYNSAVTNERLQRKDNPAHGVKVAQRADPAKRRLPFDDADAALILATSRREQGSKRWIPWLLAFTGARLDEVSQARKSDVRQEAGIWYLDINFEHGKKLKNVGSARRVPLHRAILDEGFEGYVRSLPEDSLLFPELKPDRFGSPGGKATKVIGRWIRGLGITDPRKAPSHSWRHRFKDVCRRAGVEKAIHDALTGHASSDVGDQYGLGYPLETLAEAIAKLPVPKPGELCSKMPPEEEAA